jgi:hypothetical protein
MHVSNDPAWSVHPTDRPIASPRRRVVAVARLVNRRLGWTTSEAVA